tara:strand:- start:4225 stop:4419 length:195 start_codon:yes stop_codon:yes gene_type:complete
LDCQSDTNRIVAASAREKGTTIYRLFEGALVEAQNFHEVRSIQTARKLAKALLEAVSNQGSVGS